MFSFDQFYMIYLWLTVTASSKSLFVLSLSKFSFYVTIIVAFVPLWLWCQSIVVNIL